MKRFLLMFCVVIFLGGCSNISKYEGLTAEEWFNEYDAIEAESDGLTNQISELELERDDLQVQLDDVWLERDDLQVQLDNTISQLSNLQNDFDSLKSCIRMWSDDVENCYYRY